MGLISSLLNILIVTLGALAISSSFSFTSQASGRLDTRHSLIKLTAFELGRARAHILGIGSLSAALAKVATGDLTKFGEPAPDLSDPTIFKAMFGDLPERAITVRHTTKAEFKFTAKAFRLEADGSATELTPSSPDKIENVDFILVHSEARVPDAVPPIYIERKMVISR